MMYIKIDNPQYVALDPEEYPVMQRVQRERLQARKTVSDSWYVDTPHPRHNAENVHAIQADGHELDLILSSFQNLVHTEKEVQIWYGDLARTIYANLFGMP